ncbi:hypothetical protein ACA910_016467 [Epithemia clementina (nom. ined.)]
MAPSSSPAASKTLADHEPNSTSSSSPPPPRRSSPGSPLRPSPPSKGGTNNTTTTNTNHAPTTNGGKTHHKASAGQPQQARSGSTQPTTAAAVPLKRSSTAPNHKKSTINGGNQNYNHHPTRAHGSSPRRRRPSESGLASQSPQQQQQQNNQHQQPPHRLQPNHLKFRPTASSVGSRSPPPSVTSTIPRNHNRHRLDRFGFIVNIDANGNVTDVEDEEYYYDDTVVAALDHSRSGDTTTPHHQYPLKTKHASIYNDNDPHRVPTFAEYQRTQRRAKKWDAMMGRWSVPEQKHVAPPTPFALPGRSNHNHNTRSNNKVKGKRRSTSVPPRPPSSSTNTNAAAAADGFNNNKSIHRRKVVTRLRKGVPDHLRGQVWQYLARVPQKMKQHKGLYMRLVKHAIEHHIRAAEHFDRLDDPKQQQQPSQQNQNGGNNNGATQQPPLTAALSFTSSSTSTASLIEHAKSFKSIQDTIERDIHRTYPRHHLFYEAEEEDDEEEEEVMSQLDLLPPVDPPRDNNTNTNGTSNNSPRQRGGNNNNGTKETNSPASSPPRNNAARASLSSEENDNSPQQQQQQQGSLLHRNPSFHRSGSPTESAQLRMAAGSLSDEDQTTFAEDEDDDDDDRFQTVGQFCGNEEISNIIREWEGAVAGEDSAAALAKYIAASSSSTTTQPPPTAQPSHSLPGLRHPNNAVLPARVADAVGGQASLRRVLKAYSVYDREIGYCQGMNFVAGMFLTLMPEEEAFWLLVSVMNEEPCRMRGLFGEGMRETHLVLHVAERLIQMHLPKVYKQLDKENIHITMFATQWLLTQYTSSFRFDLVLRVWDAFLGEGWKITYRVMLALLKIHEAQILQSSFEDVLALVRELPDRVSGNTVIETALEIPLKRQTIQKLEMEWYGNNALPEAQPATTASVSSSVSSKKKKASSSTNASLVPPGVHGAKPMTRTNAGLASRTANTTAASASNGRATAAAGAARNAADGATTTGSSGPQSPQRATASPPSEPPTPKTTNHSNHNNNNNNNNNKNPSRITNQARTLQLPQPFPKKPNAATSSAAPASSTTAAKKKVASAPTTTTTTTGLISV